MGLDTVLETERLRLTNWLPEHLDELMTLHGHPDVARLLDADGVPWPREKARERLELWQELYRTRGLGKFRLVRKADGCFIGRAGFGVYPTNEPELGYALLPEHQGRGYAFEAASALRDWIFATSHRDHFIGLADVRNAASLRILSGIGMSPTHVGTEPSGLEAQFFIMRRPGTDG